MKKGGDTKLHLEIWRNAFTRLVLNTDLRIPHQHQLFPSHLIQKHGFFLN